MKHPILEAYLVVCKTIGVINVQWIAHYVSHSVLVNELNSLYWHYFTLRFSTKVLKRMRLSIQGDPKSMGHSFNYSKYTGSYLSYQNLQEHTAEGPLEEQASYF